MYGIREYRVTTNDVQPSLKNGKFAVYGVGIVCAGKYSITTDGSQLNVV